MMRTVDRLSRLNNIKGMSLLEIVVSLAIFAIMSVGFYGVFATVFVNMYKTSELTENVFESQQVIESRISVVKDKLKKGLMAEVADPKETHVLFSGTAQRTIYAYHLTETMVNGRHLETLIAENRPPQLEVPIIEGAITISAYRGATIEKYPNIASKDDMTISIASGQPTVDNEGILIQYLYYWYQSKPGIYTPSDPPLWPEDYMLLSGYTAKNILTIPASLGGKFVRLMVTPVGEKGAMGDSVISNDLYISALPVYSGLLLHYDASWINTTVATEYSTERVQRWLDVGPSRVGTASPPAIKPGLSLYNISGDTKATRVYGVEAATSETAYLTSATTPANSRNNLTVYFVTKFNSTTGTPGGITLMDSRSDDSDDSSNKFILKTSASFGTSGHLELARYDDTTERYVVNSSDYRTDKWEIIKLELYKDWIAIKTLVYLNGADGKYKYQSEAKNTVSFTNSMTTVPVRLGFAPGYSVGEVLVFDGMTTENDEQLILTYLFEKFRP